MKKIILSLAIIAVAGVAGVGATRAFFSSTASATGNTFTAGTLNLAIAQDSNGTPVNGWLTSQNASWNFSAMAPGGTPSVSSVWLKNIGTINGLKLGISASNVESYGGFEKQIRITSLTLGGSNLLVGGAGATIGSYVAPTSCDINVNPGAYSTMTNAIAAATTGQVICVGPGNYTSVWEGSSPIVVNKGVTIVSTGGPSVTASIPFSITASGVTIRGFSVSDPSGTYGIQISGGASNVAIKDNIITNIGTTPTTGSAQGISLQNGSVASSNFTFTGNTITNIGNLNLAYSSSVSGTSAKGIYIGDTASSGTVTGVTIKNNIISHIQASTAPWTTGRGAYGILANVLGGVTNLVVMNNSISNLEGLWSHAVGLEGNSPNASVTLNDIHDLIDHKGNTDAVGVQIESPNVSAASIVINKNNLTPNVALGIQNTTGTAVNGQNNWWGDQDPSNQIVGSVNTVGFLGGPLAGFVGGVDQNGNGYADLQDLRLTPLTNAGSGLNANEQKQLVMGLQVDGPTTGNEYQGATLTTTLTFTLSQQ